MARRFWVDSVRQECIQAANPSSAFKAMMRWGDISFPGFVICISLTSSMMLHQLGCREKKAEGCWMGQKRLCGCGLLWCVFIPLWLLCFKTFRFHDARHLRAFAMLPCSGLPCSCKFRWFDLWETHYIRLTQIGNKKQRIGQACGPYWHAFKDADGNGCYCEDSDLRAPPPACVALAPHQIVRKGLLKWAFHAVNVCGSGRVRALEMWLMASTAGVPECILCRP